jgi:NAD(P)-dependent dehydrogenase (short-subunit alcohol dehydrogenase family)
MSAADGQAGRVTLVTGGAGAGIGGAIVERMLRAGDTLIVTDVSERRIEGLRASLGRAADHHLLETMDASDESAVHTLFERIAERYERLDVLVNSVGMNRPTLLPEMETATWRRILDVSLTSHFLHVRSAWPLMVSQGAGAIVNVASIAAWSPLALGDAAYAAAKAGVLGLTRAAAAEGAAVGIRVNAVAPGLTWNEHLSKAVPEEYLRASEGMSLLSTPGQPSDVANAVHFLADAASRHITGETITVAGGHLARH